MSALFLNLLSASRGRIIRNWETSLTLILCFSVILFPFITALAISKGLYSQALISVQSGPEFSVVGEVYGAQSPLTESGLKDLREKLGLGTEKIKGRIVGRTPFFNRLVALVGLDSAELGGLFPLLQGRLMQKDNEVLVGHSLAKTFHLQPGVRFSLPANPSKIFTVAGILKATSLWDAELLVLSLSDAQAFFRMKGFVTEAQIGADPGRQVPYQARSIPGLISKKTVFQWLDKGYALTRGVFIPFWILLAALTIPAFLVSAGLGHTERIKEISLLKSLGWTQIQLMAITALECGLVSLTAAASATLVSMVWMKVFNGLLIAPFFVAETGLVPDFPIPTRYVPWPSLTGLVFIFLLQLSGSLAAVWYGTRKTPYEALR